MRKFLFVLKVMSAGIVSLGILSLFSIAYNYTGVHIDNTDGATDYKWEANQLLTTMGEGYAWFRVDENGFNNCGDKHSPNSDVDILLMGSSHMEAVNVSPKSNTGYILNELIDDKRTYNIGISGHSIYRCVSNLQDAVSCF